VAYRDHLGLIGTCAKLKALEGEPHVPTVAATLRLVGRASASASSFAPLSSLLAEEAGRIERAGKL
jgi:hypothetical protein